MKYIIYALCDPRDNSVFYIGKSCSGKDKMLRHMRPSSLKESDSPKNRKIKEIIDAGYKPTAQVIDFAKSKRELFLLETRTIRFWSKMGFNLTNVVNNVGRKNSARKKGKKTA